MRGAAIPFDLAQAHPANDKRRRRERQDDAPHAHRGMPPLAAPSAPGPTALPGDQAFLGEGASLA